MKLICYNNFITSQSTEGGYSGRVLLGKTALSVIVSPLYWSACRVSIRLMDIAAHLWYNVIRNRSGVTCVFACGEVPVSAEGFSEGD